ncbi:MAG: hypothetical protein KF771_01920 [Burkholderiales bacterium]|nr:hypothetical protein [Burkholderiales bacterium]
MPDPYAANTAISASAAAQITARAEFRVFGKDIIATVSEKMWDAAAVLQKARRMPPETYFVSRRAPGTNVKVRDGLLDIKLKTGETAEGYEIFQPAGKLRFPVESGELAAALDHLQIRMPLAGSTISFEAFTAAARGHPDLAVVGVEKVRYGFTVNGVICEYARVWFNGALIETACCESEDASAITMAAGALGIAGLPNTSYITAARRITGMI